MENHSCWDRAITTVALPGWNGILWDTLTTPPAPWAGSCVWDRVTAVLSLPGGRITS